MRRSSLFSLSSFLFPPFLRSLFILGAVPALAGCVQDTSEKETAPYGLTERTLWTTSRVIGSPDPPPKYRLRRVFPQHTVENPIFIAQDPNSERLLIAEYGGRIYSFLPNDPDAGKDLFLDWNRRVSAFSFHPRYQENGHVFVFSPTDPKLEDRKDEDGNRIKQLSRVSRFELEPGSDPPRLRPESERIIIQWPAGGHNGGEAIIGPDGYLYIATGDGTSTSDREHTGQDIDDLLAVMMRLDVERPDPAGPIPFPRTIPSSVCPGPGKRSGPTAFATRGGSASTQSRDSPGSGTWVRISGNSSSWSAGAAITAGP